MRAKIHTCFLKCPYFLSQMGQSSLFFYGKKKNNRMSSAAVVTDPLILNMHS